MLAGTRILGPMKESDRKPMTADIADIVSDGRGKSVPKVDISNLQSKLARQQPVGASGLF